MVPVAATATAVAIWVAVPRTPPEQVLREQARPAAPAAAAEPAAPARAEPRADTQERFAAETPPPAAAREADQLADRAPGDERRENSSSAPAPLAAAEAPSAGQPAAPAPRESAVALQRAAAAPLVVISPDPASRWRIGPGGIIERSTTAGQSWEATNVEPGTPLTAGWSPSPLVSWLVGPRATVLRTVDGSTFERLPFPEPVDLIEVRADSAAIAVVTASDGRRFRTENGGQSWGVVGR